MIESSREAPASESNQGRGWLALQVLWIAVRLVAVYCFAEQATPFFYQAF